jgi:hypothetical protein
MEEEKEKIWGRKTIRMRGGGNGRRIFFSAFRVSKNEDIFRKQNSMIYNRLRHTPALALSVTATEVSDTVPCPGCDITAVQQTENHAEGVQKLSWPEQ